jgi:hypothetical protein
MKPPDKSALLLLVKHCHTSRAQSSLLSLGFPWMVLSPFELMDNEPCRMVPRRRGGRIHEANRSDASPLDPTTSGVILSPTHDQGVYALVRRRWWNIAMLDPDQGSVAPGQGTPSPGQGPSSGGTETRRRRRWSGPIETLSSRVSDALPEGLAAHHLNVVLVFLSVIHHCMLGGLVRCSPPPPSPPPPPPPFAPAHHIFFGHHRFSCQVPGPSA